MGRIELPAWRYWEGPLPDCGASWRPHDADEVRALLGDDATAYEQAVLGSPLLSATV